MRTVVSELELVRVLDALLELDTVGRVDNEVLELDNDDDMLRVDDNLEELELGVVAERLVKVEVVTLLLTINVVADDGRAAARLLNDATTDDD